MGDGTSVDDHHFDSYSRIAWQRINCRSCIWHTLNSFSDFLVLFYVSECLEQSKRCCKCIPDTHDTNSMLQLSSANASVKRLELFFNLRDQSNERYSRRREPPFANNPVVEIKNGSFSWTNEKPSLHKINLTVSATGTLILSL